MSKRKLLAMRLVVFALIVFALTVAFPAGAHTEACPPGWVPVPANSEEAKAADNSGEGVVCMKTVPGESRGDPGVIYKDDHSHVSF